MCYKFLLFHFIGRVQFAIVFWLVILIVMTIRVTVHPMFPRVLNQRLQFLKSYPRAMQLDESTVQCSRWKKWYSRQLCPQLWRMPKRCVDHKLFDSFLVIVIMMICREDGEGGIIYRHLVANIWVWVLAGKNKRRYAGRSWTSVKLTFIRVLWGRVIRARKTPHDRK